MLANPPDWLRVMTIATGMLGACHKAMVGPAGFEPAT